MWLGPPTMNRKITDFALAAKCCGLARERIHPRLGAVPSRSSSYSSAIAPKPCAGSRKDVAPCQRGPDMFRGCRRIHCDSTGPDKNRRASRPGGGIALPCHLDRLRRARQRQPVGAPQAAIRRSCRTPLQPRWRAASDCSLHEVAVEQRQGLQRVRAGRPHRAGGHRIRLIESRHHGQTHGALVQQVKAAAILFGFRRDGPQAVALAFGEDADRRLPARSAHERAGRRAADSAGRRRPARCRESSRLPGACGSCASRTCSPGRSSRFRRIVGARLPVRAREHDQPVDRLHAPAALHELRRQPVEQLLDRGPLSPSTPKSFGVAHQPRPMRNCQMRFTITRAVSGLFGRGQPVRQCGPPPGVCCGQARSPPAPGSSTSGKPGSTWPSFASRPDLQDESWAAGPCPCSLRRKPRAAAPASCQFDLHAASARSAVRRSTICRRQRVATTLIPGGLDLRFGILGQLPAPRSRLAFGNLQRLAQLRLELLLLRLASAARDMASRSPRSASLTGLRRAS